MRFLIALPGKQDLIERIKAAFPGETFVVVATPQEILSHIEACDALIVANSGYTAGVARAICERGSRLRWIQFTTAGVDWAIDVGLPEGVIVTNASGFNAPVVAEHALALLLALARRLNETDAMRAERTWPRDVFLGRSLPLVYGTMALVGLGAVGREIARKAKAFDMRVIGVSRSAGSVPNVDEVRPRERLRETVAVADALVLATNYDASSHHLIDAATIGAMKPCAILVNVARGTLIEEPALIDALIAQRIAAAGLDVAEPEPPAPDSPLWTLPNVVLTPHSAGAGRERLNILFDIITGNIRRFLAGEPLAFRVGALGGPRSAKPG